MGGDVGTESGRDSSKSRGSEKRRHLRPLLQNLGKVTKYSNGVRYLYQSSNSGRCRRCDLANDPLSSLVFFWLTIRRCKMKETCLPRSQLNAEPSLPACLLITDALRTSIRISENAQAAGRGLQFWIRLPCICHLLFPLAATQCLQGQTWIS